MNIGFVQQGIDLNRSAAFALVMALGLSAVVLVAPATDAQTTYNYTGVLQTYTVPAGVTSINIEARGAQGGTVTGNGGPFPGGLGATMSGDFAVTPGTVLNVIVGGQGNPDASSSGGGGGSGVADGATPLVIAGGGAGIDFQAPSQAQIHATTATSGNAGGGGGAAGGVAGGDGGDNAYTANDIARGGRGFNFSNAGSFGQNGTSPNTTFTNGSFGLGGGGGSVGYGWCNCGGGGGGYSGGGAAGINNSGGGGGSFNSGTNQVNTAGNNAGNGVVIITELVLAGAPFPANAALGPATLDDYESCDVTVQPAATLLLPYFEVDPSGFGENTLVTVTNVSDTSIVAHVTVWTNWSFPVLDFNLFLTGYDVVSLSLRDLLVSGNIPNTQRGTASPLGVRSRVGASTRIEAPYTTALLAATCANPQGGNGAVPGFLLSQIQSGLTGGPYSAGGVACGQVGDVSDNMIGYITFDTSAVCSQSLPTDAPYFTTEIRWENQLIGDYIRLNDAAGVAGGNPLVHIKALPGGDSTPVTTLEWTFYNRYQGGVGVADRRQPLPALFAGRYIEAGTAFDTDFVVWREGVTDEVDTVDCNGALALNASFPYVEVVRFDERENPTTRIGGCQVSPCPPNIGLSETQLINVNNTSFIPSDPSADTGGWVYFNLTIPELDPLGWGRPSQNWVQVRMTGASLYGVDFDASYLGNGCQYHVGLTLPDGGTGSSSSGEKIGPKYERGTLTGWIGN